jgi:asparagine synthase (glutamine-hydrolysing)
MCGILAHINKGIPIDNKLFSEMRDTMVHRGPDDHGSFFSKDGRAALGHRRLSIIDLSELGRQPMSNEDGTIWLSFNGEIYNFQDLRKVLEAKGHRFRSRTDSEVIVHAYEQWGEGCLERLWGMFAFVIWDDGKKVLFGARDRLGVKPLHYHHSGDKFVCASEIKAIVEDPEIPRRLDRSAICDFFTYRYIPAPKTVWQDVRKLPPAHAFVYSADGLRIWKYWGLEPGDEFISEEKALEHLGELLEDAVRLRLISDVPLGLFLSGGLDSTAVAWEMKRLKTEIKTFTIGFSGTNDDETPDAERVARLFDTRHHAEFLSEKEFEGLAELVWYFDEPFGASSMLPTFLVSKVAKKNVTVALSGDGGDEAFAGYNWYDTLLNQVAAGWKRRWLALLRGKDGAGLAERYRRTTTPRFERKELHGLFTEPLEEIEPNELWFFEKAINRNLSGVKQLQWLDTHTFLPEEVLTKVDRASMANSLEVRSPFLDHRLFEWSFSLSDRVYFNGEKKHLIKALLRDELPGSVIKKRKQGFSAPVNLYWNDERVNGILSRSRAVSDGLFSRSFVENLIKEPDAGRTFSRRWLLMVFELWYRRWISGD